MRTRDGALRSSRAVGAPPLTRLSQKTDSVKGVLVAIALLLIVEAWVHADAFLHRYRSVFAAGRAMDKVLFVESARPRLVVAGNSRVDNGFDPAVLAAGLGLDQTASAFNLGVPGADARALHDIFRRLDRQGLLGDGGISHVVLGLDESLLQADDTLGYRLFFGRPGELLREGELAAALGWLVRLWGYAPNLKQLREPEKALRFVRATFVEIEPVGGGAREHLGYRAGFGAEQFQDAGQLARQEAGTRAPPQRRVTASLYELLDLLERRGVRVAIVVPPLLNRDSLLVDTGDPAARPYLRVAAQLKGRGLEPLILDRGEGRDPAEFINAGHLNDRGAKRFSALLAQRLRPLWPELGGRAR